jgi:acetoin utilization protein AcuC
MKSGLIKISPGRSVWPGSLCRLAYNRLFNLPFGRIVVENSKVLVLKGDNIAAYGFGEDHPFGPDRHDAFHAELERSGLASQVELRAASMASMEELSAFHTVGYIDEVRRLCAGGQGFLDAGDTPALAGIDEAAAAVVGATVAAMDSIMAQRSVRAFVPIGGLHHAGRSHAAGFCVFNDCGVAIELLRARYHLSRIAYVDIDAHHGDGVYYAFEDDPNLFFADIHEDGRYLYPGTGHAGETGTETAVGTKLNLPMAPGVGDDDFRAVWAEVETFLEAARPEFILFQCGADSVAGDPITHLQFSPAAHGYAAERLCLIADRHCSGRVLAMGGGGYNRDNLALAWTAVVRAFVASF